MHHLPAMAREWQRLQTVLAGPPLLRRSPPTESHSQAWREQDGRWVPDGWLKPGYFADPPQFDPLPGERLSTPAFEADAFQSLASTGPIDVVIPLSAGSPCDDAELRYALRSIEQNLESVGTIWIVGHRPKWFRDTRHIPFADSHRSKDVNIIRKLEAACRAGVSEHFLFWSDDQLLLRPLAWSQLGPYTWGPVHEHNGRDGRWHRRLVATRDWLRAEGFHTAWHCDTHTPIPMERSRLLELAELSRESWEAGDGFTIGTWYCNGAETRPRPMGQRKATIEAGLPSPQLRAAIAGRWFLGHNDAGFTPELRALLDELFPEQCRGEK